jgi:basic amino acid/polyamine antiporter, APA family
VSTQFVFARKASGLTRGLSTADVFGMALMYIQPILGIYVAIQLGSAVFPGGNLLISLGISFLTAGVFGPLMWGMLSGTMPRSGGEYIFNSRILSAPLAQAASTASCTGMIYFCFLTSTYVASSLRLLCAFMGWGGAAAWLANRYAVILVGVVVLILAFVVVAFGMRMYKRVQKPFVIVGIGGPLVLLFSIALASRAGFVQNWNELAGRFGSLDYQSFAPAVENVIRRPLPVTWNWHDTFGMTGAISILLIMYAIVYVGGEVKRPEKTMIVSGWFAVGTTVAIAAGTFFALYRTLGFTFANAAAVNNLIGGVPGYAFPFPSNYLTLAWIGAGHSAFVGWVATLTLALTSFWVVVIMFLLAGRTLFAWGMDRMGPRWFTSVSSRHAGPLRNFVAWLVACVVGLVIYEIWLPSLTALIGTGVLMISVFLVTGISALVLPFRKRTADIWNSSPYRGWRIARVPLIAVAGAIWVLYTCVLLYYEFFDATSRAVTGRNTIYFLLVTWTMGALWYSFWSWRSRAVGVDVGVAYGQLPPE